MNDEKGVWRTICGRKVFIAEGQTLTEAMKASGKFSKGDIKKAGDGGGDSKPADGKTEKPKEKTVEEAPKPKQSVSDYVTKYRNGDKVDAEILVSTVGKRERAALGELLGKEVDATKHVLAIDELRHIEKGHGAKGVSDHSMSDPAAYDSIPDVLAHFDSVDFCLDKSGQVVTSYKYAGRDNKPSPMVMFTKKFEGRTQMVVEAICDTKAGKLRIISSYAKKNKKED